MLLPAWGFISSSVYELPGVLERSQQLVGSANFIPYTSTSTFSTQLLLVVPLKQVTSDQRLKSLIRKDVQTTCNLK